MTQDQRRAVRTIIYAISSLVFLGFMGWIIAKANMSTLQIIASGLLAILFVYALGYIAENVAARIKISAGPAGFKGEIDSAGEEQRVADATQVRADVAQDKADATQDNADMAQNRANEA